MLKRTVWTFNIQYTEGKPDTVVLLSVPMKWDLASYLPVLVEPFIDFPGVYRFWNWLVNWSDEDRRATARYEVTVTDDEFAKVFGLEVC